VKIQRSYRRNPSYGFYAILLALFAVLILSGGRNRQIENLEDWRLEGTSWENGSVFQKLTAGQAAGKNRIREGKRSSYKGTGQVFSFLPMDCQVLQKSDLVFQYKNVQNRKKNFRIKRHIQRRGPPSI